MTPLRFSCKSNYFSIKSSLGRKRHFRGSPVCSGVAPPPPERAASPCPFARSSSHRLGSNHIGGRGRRAAAPHGPAAPAPGPPCGLRVTSSQRGAPCGGNRSPGPLCASAPTRDARPMDSPPPQRLSEHSGNSLCPPHIVTGVTLGSWVAMWPPQARARTSRPQGISWPPTFSLLLPDTPWPMEGVRRPAP